MTSNLDYYRGLGFDKIYSWSEKDITQFLFWDVFSGERFINYQSALLKITDSFLQKYNKHKLAIDFLDRIFLKLAVSNKEANKEKILFQWVKSPNIILEVKKHYPINLIAAGKKERLFALRNLIGYLSVTDLERCVYDYLAKKEVKYLYELLRKTEEKIKLISPDYVVLWNDSLPIERAMVLVAKKLGICTIDIQPGIYSKNITDGRVADYKLVWGNYIKDLYISQGIRKPEEIYILGYPYLIPKSKPIPKEQKKYTLYYLGQNYEDFDEKFLKPKIETIIKINDICNKLNIKFVYRPHPAENRDRIKNEASEVYFSPREESLEESYNKGEIFVSFSSTSLVEAAMRSRVSLQLINYPIEIYNFEETGACHKSFYHIEEMEKFLGELVKEPNFIHKMGKRPTKDYIDMSYNSGERFLEILEEIDKKRRKF